MADSRLRTLAKTVSYRILGSKLTALAAWWITRDLRVGAAVGGADVLIKSVFYYLHERVWIALGDRRARRSSSPLAKGSATPRPLVVSLSNHERDSVSPARPSTGSGRAGEEPVTA